MYSQFIVMLIVTCTMISYYYVTWSSDDVKDSVTVNNKPSYLHRDIVLRMLKTNIDHNALFKIAAAI